MPKLWNESIEAHRREVRDAILNIAGALATEHGLRALTMSKIAEETGIGRATLYKYFSNVEAILVAWHERQVSHHFAHLAAIGKQAGKAAERLAAVLMAYALISYEHHSTELEALVHRGEHVAQTQKQLSDLLRGLLNEGVKTGDFRDDIASNELAIY